MPTNEEPKESIEEEKQVNPKFAKALDNFESHVDEQFALIYDKVDELIQEYLKANDISDEEAKANGSRIVYPEASLSEFPDIAYWEDFQYKQEPIVSVIGYFSENEKDGKVEIIFGINKRFE